MAMTFLSLLFVACGSQPSASFPEEGALQLDAELFLRRGDEVVVVTPKALFEEATSQLAAENHADCAANFDTLWRALPDTEFYVPSLYDAGLCHERQEAWEEAAERYQLLIAAAEGSRDGLDAMFRLAETDANTGEWARVVQTMGRALERDDLRNFDAIEALYRVGMARLALNEYPEAETAFRSAVKRNRKAGTARLSNRNYYIAGVHYGIALASHMMFGEIKFRLPEDAMLRAMEDKKQLAHQAYLRYIETVRCKNQYWSILSGYMVGKLFEDFYYDILAAEIPTNLSDEELRAYFRDIRDEIKPLLDKALEAYEKTSAVSERIGFENYWVERTDERMERLRGYMKDEALLREEEAAIVAWNTKLRALEARRATEPHDADLMVPPPSPPLPIAKAAAPQ